MTHTAVWTRRAAAAACMHACMARPCQFARCMQRPPPIPHDNAGWICSRRRPPSSSEPVSDPSHFARTLLACRSPASPPCSEVDLAASSCVLLSTGPRALPWRLNSKVGSRGSSAARSSTMQYNAVQCSTVRYGAVWSSLALSCPGRLNSKVVVGGGTVAWEVHNAVQAGPVGPVLPCLALACTLCMGAAVRHCIARFLSPPWSSSWVQTYSMRPFMGRGRCLCRGVRCLVAPQATTHPPLRLTVHCSPPCWVGLGSRREPWRARAGDRLMR